MTNAEASVKPTCDYCDKPPTYAFMDGERICAQCLGRFPYSQRAHRLRIRELEVLLEAAQRTAAIALGGAAAHAERVLELEAKS